MRQRTPTRRTFLNPNWPVLRQYEGVHLRRIAMPLGGIGTGTVSLGGRGNLLDWEIVNRPAKGFLPFVAGLTVQRTAPFFAIRVKTPSSPPIVRLLEGRLNEEDLEGDQGSRAANHGCPRFRGSTFAAAYPLAQVLLSDPDVPLRVRLEALNPLVPGDVDASSIPCALFRFVLVNPTARPIEASLCGCLPNFIGADGANSTQAWSGIEDASGACKGNRNEFRRTSGLAGLYMYSTGLDKSAEQWGTMALTTSADNDVSFRTAWARDEGWGRPLLDFWEDFASDGRLDGREAVEGVMPTGSLAVSLSVPPRGQREVSFLLTWHFPNRRTWSPAKAQASCSCECDKTEIVGNHYAMQYADAWDAASRAQRQLGDLERRTVAFVRAFCDSDLPAVVKEAALFNVSTLRTQTCFRTADGAFMGWEGCHDHSGCCWGSCTHVWNYEQATAMLFGELSRNMRQTELSRATDEIGRMSFRVQLPLAKAQEVGKAAADGQMGCIMKLYRDWQLSGDDDLLRQLWPAARKCLEFCWIPGGWDADRDGVMEGCQHNTMDVEYYGPNPQMTGWYLGALRAAEEMALHLGEVEFAGLCRGLFDRGSKWMDDNLFNGQYYRHEVRLPESEQDIAAGLRVWAKGQPTDYWQLGDGCLVDQLAGQYMAHVCGLGYLHDRKHVRKTLSSILKHNRPAGFADGLNHMRGYVACDERGLVMAAYPGKKPARPFPYYTEVMTGFEYTAAVGMLYEGMLPQGLEVISDIRARYDGSRRNPFNEAECGHHYARAMASWAAVPAMTGFHYSAVTGTIRFAATDKPSVFFWSTGDAWGTFAQRRIGRGADVQLKVLSGSLKLRAIHLSRAGELELPKPAILTRKRAMRVRIPRGREPIGKEE